MTQLQFKTKPYTHQLQWLEQTKDLEYYAIYAEMGTGKSKYAIDLATYLYLDKKIKQVLIITKNGVDQQFIEEAIPEHLALEKDQFFCEHWHSSYGGWKKYDKYNQFLVKELIILAINCEALATKKGVKACKEFAGRRPTLLIVDESQEFSNIDSQRTKNLLSFVSLFPYRRIMTGTPSGGDPRHLYSQFQILSSDIFPISKWGFEAKYCVKEKQYVWIHKVDGSGNKIKYKRFYNAIVAYKNLDQLQKVVGKYSSRLLKEDCLDLPNKIYKKVPFVLSKDEQDLYNKLKKEILVEIAPGKHIATDLAITKLIRLQQITCGFIPTENLETGERQVELFSTQTRLGVLLDTLRLTIGKVLIWATFTMSINQIMEMVEREFGLNSVVRYDGKTSDSQKQSNKIAFKNNEEVRFLVGHPKAGGVGLDLPEASTAVYYSNDYHLISRLQSEDRCHRIGTKKPVTYIDLIAQNTVDNRILSALKSKFDIASGLTGDLLREWIS